MKWYLKKSIYTISLKGCLSEASAASTCIIFSPLQYSITLLRLILGRAMSGFLPEWVFWGFLEGSWSCRGRRWKSVLTSSSDSWYSFFLVLQDPSSGSQTKMTMTASRAAGFQRPATLYPRLSYYVSGEFHSMDQWACYAHTGPLSAQ